MAEDRRKAALARSCASRKADVRRRVLVALKELEARGMRITVSSVADAAGVTRATVYNHPDLCKLIKEKTRRQNETTHRLGSRRDREVREIANLKREVGRLRGKVRWRDDVIRVINTEGPLDIDDEPIRLD